MEHTRTRPQGGGRRAEDLTGRTFGRLVVVSWASRQAQGHAWMCQCECGGSKAVLAQSLRAGRSTSCGCAQREATSAACLRSLVGQRHGMLAVVERAPSRGKNRAVWWSLVCDCGGTIEMRGDHFLRGNRSDCGCLRSRIHREMHAGLRPHDAEVATEVALAAALEITDACILWTGPRDDRGYGTTGERHLRTRQAHRAIWSLTGGSLPRHMTLDHMCRTPACVNPFHLELVTNEENLRRMHLARDWQRDNGRALVGRESLAVFRDARDRSSVDPGQAVPG